MIADPTVLLPHETPDGLWHLFANTIPPRLHHFVSEDGLSFRKVGELGHAGMRPFVRLMEDGDYHLFYEQITWPVPLRSRIVHCRSSDLLTWTSPRTVLSPSLLWHGGFNRTCGNPCVVFWQGEYLLYYSAATVFLPDCLFVEPRHIGVARSRQVEGPYIPDPYPCLSPDPSVPNRNMGAGSIKVLPDPDGNGLLGLSNGIYRDAKGHSRSSIRLVQSTDGTNWEDVGDGPVLAPGGDGWKKALVYALDVRVLPDNRWVVYFNARDGWLVGKERIGVAYGVRCVPIVGA
jgi:hypothetical protein